MNFSRANIFVFLFLYLCACSPKVIKDKIDPPLEQLRILTYNIHHANPPSKEGLIDLDTIAAVIAKQDPDLVALQEVDVLTNRSGKLDEAAILASKLKMQVYFAKAIDHDGGEYGVAILSKYPISDQITYKLPNNGSSDAEPRVLAMLTVNLPGAKQIKFASTHLDAQGSDSNRLLQITEINQIAKNEQMPLIIGGDLNANPASRVIREFDQQFFRSCGDCPYTIPEIKPTQAIDFIAFKIGDPFQILSHEVIPEPYASDHLPVLVTLKLGL